MADVIPFRQRRAAAHGVAEYRAQIEAAAQSCLDTADRLIAVLDQIDAHPDDEDGGDAEPSLGAPECHASQVTWLRGTTRDLEHNRHQEQHP